jgi:hypothetical protein
MIKTQLKAHFPRLELQFLLLKVAVIVFEIKHGLAISMPKDKPNLNPVLMYETISQLPLAGYNLKTGEAQAR